LTNLKVKLIRIKLHALNGTSQIMAVEIFVDFGAIEEREPMNWLFIATVVSGLVAFALAFINQKTRRNF
jgi:hypothetical protein